MKEYGPWDYRAGAQIYQQLKKNYDGRLDYWTANEFHFGEMEMQRLAVRESGPFWLRKLRRLWHPHCSMLAWYRRVSDYGNSYRKPLVWLISVLILFALGYPLFGLQHTSPVFIETYHSVWPTIPHSDIRIDGTAGYVSEAELIAKSFMVSVETAGLQKGTEFVPTYPYGRALALFELLLTSTLFAIFLIAVRRQFRR